MEDVGLLLLLQASAAAFGHPKLSGAPAAQSPAADPRPSPIMARKKGFPFKLSCLQISHAFGFSKALWKTFLDILKHFVLFGPDGSIKSKWTMSSTPNFLRLMTSELSGAQTVKSARPPATELKLLRIISGYVLSGSSFSKVWPFVGVGSKLDGQASRV